jgi:hypothetical protein
MLRQYQLHGGIHRLQTRFDRSKRFGTTTTMAASTAPTPWNRPPPSVNDFRWWDEFFLKLSRPLTSEDAPTVHRTKYSGDPHHGKVHTLLVPALEELFSRLDEPRLKKRKHKNSILFMPPNHPFPPRPPHPTKSPQEQPHTARQSYPSLERILSPAKSRS